MRSITSTVLVAVLLLVARVGISASPEKAAEKKPFDLLKSLEGTWEKTGPDGKPTAVSFHTSAAGSVVIETMFAGSQHEMMNAYHMDGDNLIVTHYCAQGVQPRMKMA